MQVAVKIKDAGKKAESCLYLITNEVSILRIPVQLPSDKNVTYRTTEENRCSSEWPFQPYLIFDVGDGHEERENE